jgi:hypothetical protein
VTEPSVAVRCEGDAAAGWTCAVSIESGGRELSRHRVAVRPSTLGRLAPRSTAPEPLVRASFDFLLEREPPSAILPEFDLELIGRYFPEWEAHIERGTGGG